MTIEIKQLVIRAVVEERRERTPAAPAPRGRTVPEPTRRSAARAPIDQDAIVEEVVRQVMRELRRGRGR